jgi:PAS domain S-box-containing protein
MKKYPLPYECSLKEDDPLRMLLEGTATATGERFFEALVENMAAALDTRHAWITEYDSEKRRLKALAFWVGGGLLSDFEIDIAGTPCEAVIDKSQLVLYPDNILKLFPHSEKLKELGAVSYMGVPLLDLDRTTLGHLAVIDDRPMPEEPGRLALFQIFAARAAAELQRLRAEAELKEREKKLGGLVANAMDAIIELDADFDMVLVNPAAQKLLHNRRQNGARSNFSRFLTQDSRRKLTGLAAEIGSRPPGEKSVWVPGGLQIINAEGSRIATEATLSQFEMQRRCFYSLILRSIDERIEAERKISHLREETAYLKEEIKSLDNFEEIVGQSRLLLKVMKSAKQVAQTDSTVLILGETGTGKELIARTVHRSGRRSGQPFIKLNCATLPEKLVESELFGHETGAYTGADRRRRGRFELAHGGTLFLDEIGELSLDVQAKLLRVLQEGQFERVGGSKTLAVDVRVIAASNRDLQKDIVAGRFRADLFYRLNVYPIIAPPLRDRKEDIPLLVEYFVMKLSARIGKPILRIPSATIEQMLAYEWPGNVRELKNVVERAIITSPTAELQLSEALSHRTAAPNMPESTTEEMPATLETVERKHIMRVLESTGWRISGPKGAARILDLNPSTLRYRIKKLGIQTPW